MARTASSSQTAAAARRSDRQTNDLRHEPAVTPAGLFTNNFWGRRRLLSPFHWPVLRGFYPIMGGLRCRSCSAAFCHRLSGPGRRSDIQAHQRHPVRADAFFHLSDGHRRVEDDVFGEQVLKPGETDQHYYRRWPRCLQIRHALRIRRGFRPRFDRGYAGSLPARQLHDPRIAIPRWSSNLPCKKGGAGFSGGALPTRNARACLQTPLRVISRRGEFSGGSFERTVLIDR